jgi:hypothetical protein
MTDALAVCHNVPLWAHCAAEERVVAPEHAQLAALARSSIAQCAADSSFVASGQSRTRWSGHQAIERRTEVAPHPPERGRTQRNAHSFGIPHAGALTGD